MAQLSRTDCDADADAGVVGKAVAATGVIPCNACWTRSVWAGLTVSVLACEYVSGDDDALPLPLPLPSGPQMTRRMGKSFAQLLTSNAVLIAVGLAGVGGGRGWMA